MQEFILFVLTIILTGLTATSRADNIWDTGYRKILVEDTARSEVIYVHIANDRVLNQQEVKYEMLSIGDRIMTYGGYDNYQLDSLFSTFPVKPSVTEGAKIARKYETIPESMKIEPAKGTLDFYGKVFINPYRYSEPIPEIKWTLTDETENILGYECHKATARWRGREWNAWYADIPVNAGPWKFQGLPGLILKVEDTTKDHSIFAIGMENIVYPIGHPYKPYCKSTREKYNEAKADYAANMGKTFVNSGMIKFKSEEEKARIAKRRRFHAPLELE